MRKQAIPRRSRILRSLAAFLLLLTSLCGCAGPETASGPSESEAPLYVPEGFSLYADDERGLSFLYPSGRSTADSGEDGVRVCCGEDEDAPYVSVLRTEGVAKVEDYFDSCARELVKSSSPVASTKIHTVDIEGRTLYMVRYVCGKSGKELVIDKYLEPRDGFYLQYASVSPEECSLDTELYYAIYTLRPSADAYTDSFSTGTASHFNPDTGISIDIPNMLETNELYVGFFARSGDAVLLAVFIDVDDEGQPIYNRQDFIDRAAVSNTFVADQLGADSVSFTEGKEELLGSRSFYRYPMRMTLGEELYGGSLYLANADDSGCYLICCAVRDDCSRRDELEALLDSCAESFKIRGGIK